MKRENIITKKSFAFAVKTVTATRWLMQEKKEFILSKQLMRSATSIGANIEEGCQAESKKDFIHKLSISNKELYESRYWIKLLLETKIIDKKNRT